MPGPDLRDVFAWTDRIPGGEADSMHPLDFDRDQLIKGLSHEMEHTDDPRIALEITIDHLTEDPRYYDHLDV